MKDIKVLKQKPLTAVERIYLFNVLKGLGTTLRHFFSKKNVEGYPEKRFVPPERVRGFPKLALRDDGIPKCVACKLCEIVCPAEAITIEIGEYERPQLQERVPRQFIIDHGRCICCGYCEEACPEDAIVMSEVLELAQDNRCKFIFKKDILLGSYDGIEEKLFAAETVEQLSAEDKDGLGKKKTTGKR